MNLTLIDANSNNSPFDSIRHYDEQGNEFWLARELMTMLNYLKWERFNGVIETAIENLETVCNNVSSHFFPDEGKTKGRPRLDYKLSRLACYHIALCCDSRGNDAVKMAKHYFAVKTRQAEVAEFKTPQTYLEALKALVASEEEKEILKLENQQLEKDNQILAEAVDELFNYSSIVRIAKFNGVSEKIFSYHRLKAVSQQMGLEIKKVPCPRFEYKLLYSHDAWRVAYPDVALPETTTLRVYRSA